MLGYNVNILILSVRSVLFVFSAERVRSTPATVTSETFRPWHVPSLSTLTQSRSCTSLSGHHTRGRHPAVFAHSQLLPDPWHLSYYYDCLLQRYTTKQVWPPDNILLRLNRTFAMDPSAWLYFTHPGVLLGHLDSLSHLVAEGLLAILLLVRLLDVLLVYIVCLCVVVVLCLLDI